MKKSPKLKNIKIELRDVLHLYRGCEIECEKGFYKFKAILIDCEGTEDEELWVVAENDHLGEGSFNLEDCKPILRKLTDKEITEEEYKYIWGDLNIAIPFIGADVAMPIRLFLYLLKQGFDLFGLIESGQAIEKAKKKTKVKSKQLEIHDKMDKVINLTDKLIETIDKEKKNKKKK